MPKANNSNYHLYNKNLKGYASENRNASTKAEACIWKYVLKNGNMKGYAFRRQRPVLQYIADFMCKELKLIIEIDGISHSWDEVTVKDDARQKVLEAAGFVMLRFTDEEVLTGIQSVFEKVEECIEELEMRRRKISY